MSRLKRLIQDLLRRRVPHFLAVYLAAGWAVLEFTDFLFNRYALSPYLIDLALLGWTLMIPSVLMLAWYYGAPGRDERSRVGTVGVSANVLLTAVLLTVVFAGKDLGAVTHKITVADEAGTAVERVVPKSEFRKRIAIFYFTNISADTTLDWLQLGIPLALQDDLIQDMFMVVRAGWPFFRERLEEAGFPDGIGVPFALRREMAEELHLNHMVSGTVAGRVDSLVLTVDLHDVARGRLLSEHSFTGSDPFDIVDRISLRLKRDLEVPARHIENVRDLPTAELLTASVAAFKAFVAGWRALEADQWQSAAQGFAAAAEIDPTYASANLMLHMVSLLANDTEAGSRALEAAMQHSYKLPERAQFSLRTAYYRLKQDPAKTMATAGAHAELFPDDVTAQQSLLVLYSQAGEWDKAIAAARRLLDLDPGEYDVLRTIAQLYIEQGAYEQAREYYERYAIELPEDPRAFSGLGDLSRIVGEHDRALEYYDRALVLDPTNTAVLADIARTETSLGRFESAERHLEEAREQAATAMQEFQSLSAFRLYLERRGQMQRAIEVMQDSWVALDIAQPPLVAAQLKLRQLGTYVRADRDDLADAALEDIKRQLSPPFDVLASIGQYIIAEETEDAASLEESLAELERLIASLGFESLRPLITFGGGRLLEIRGDCEQAIISYKRALEMQPGDRGPNTSIGRCYRVLGDFEMAKSHLLTSITLDPFSPTVNLELARVYSDEGDRERALEHLSTALVVWSNADPEYEPARQARDMYAELGSN